MQILDQLDIIAIDVTIPTGQRKLAAEDLKLAGALPEAVVQLGTKRTIDPNDLKVFYTLKRRAERYCDSVGVRFLSGYAVPRHLTQGITESIEKTRLEFEDEKARFVSSYTEKVEAWIAQHPAFEHALRRAVWTKSEISARLSFGHAAYRMAAADHPGQLGTMVAQLGNTLLDEVATDAMEILERSIVPIQKGEQKLTRRILSPLQRIRDKLNGLAFVDPAVAPVVDAIDALLKKAGSDGELTPLLQEITNLTLVLVDPDKMRRIGSVLLPAAPVQAEIGFLGMPVDTTDDEDTNKETSTVTTGTAPVPQGEPEEDPDVALFESMLTGGEPVGNDVAVTAASPAKEETAPEEKADPALPEPVKVQEVGVQPADELDTAELMF